MIESLNAQSFKEKRKLVTVRLISAIEEMQWVY